MEGDTIVRNQPHAHLQDSGAPPLLLGWQRLCRQVNSALFFFKLVLFSPCPFSTVVCPRFAPVIGGHSANLGRTLKKKFRRLLAPI